MRADADRDRQRALLLIGALCEKPHVVRRDDVDAGERLLLDDEAVDAAVHAELGIARDHDARGDHRPAVIDRRHGDRQLEQIDIIAGGDHFGRARGVDHDRRDRIVDRLLELQLDIAIGLRAHADHGALARADDAGHDRHVVADDVVEQQRLVRLIDQGGDMADVDRLLEVDQLVLFPQAVEELPEILLHS
jgi:hypothetical protein